MFDGRRQDPTDEVPGCMLLSLHGRCGLELSCQVKCLQGSITLNLNVDGSRKECGGLWGSNPCGSDCRWIGLAWGGGLEESVVLVWTWLARDCGAGFGMRLVADLTHDPDPSGDADRWRLHPCLYHTTPHHTTHHYHYCYLYLPPTTTTSPLPTTTTTMLLLYHYYYHYY